MAADRPLCVSPRCRSRGHHLPDCRVEGCAGCQPRLAAPGLNLCDWHLRAIGEDATALPGLYLALGLALRGTGGRGDKVSGTPTSWSPEPAVIDARSQIRAGLVGWVRIITEERGFSLPRRWAVQERPWGFIGPMPMVCRVDDSIGALGRFVARHAEWLAAHGAAGEVSADLGDWAHGRPYRLAYPSGGRTFVVPGGCPGEGEPCEGVLWVQLRSADALWPSELACDVDDTHRWPARDWLRLGRLIKAREDAVAA